MLVKPAVVLWWCMPIIIALRELGQEDCEFEASLGYKVI
jgi:hypothetical protein